MPDWEEINKRLKEDELKREKFTPPDDKPPSEESWHEKCDRLQWERDEKEKARRNEPGMLKVGKTFTFDSMFGWLKIFKRN